RVRGYIDALKKHNLPLDDELLTESGLTIEDGRGKMLKLLSLDTPPDAVYVAGDYAALGALQVLKEKNIKIPEDIALVGFGNEPFTDMVTPRISSVHQHSAEIESGMIDWDAVFEGVEWFHWTGITPAISQGSADVCLEAVKAASAKGITISTDLNYRAKLWNFCDDAHREAIMTELTSYCDIVLGNEEDAEMHFGIKPEGISVQTEGHNVKAEAFLSVCEQMMVKFPRAKKVITTLRGSISASHNTWAGVLYDGKTLFQTRQYQITDIVDRVGGGDSFMGGLIYGLLKYPEDDQNALDFAVAASCLKHTIKGDANLATIAEVEKLMGGDASGRVAR
ncbi:PfkB family carbohydrate kinase, partial [bacterium]|nr:PfkB family carbohydrate kinase [bacterium]